MLVKFLALGQLLEDNRSMLIELVEDQFLNGMSWREGTMLVAAVFLLRGNCLFAFFVELLRVRRLFTSKEHLNLWLIKGLGAVEIFLVSFFGLLLVSDFFGGLENLLLLFLLVALFFLRLTSCFSRLSFYSGSSWLECHLELEVSVEFLLGDII